jgi:tRNA1(Val) A37 N6-methylase TrmN6
VQFAPLGIARGARRPDGWQAPGPAPLTPRDRLDVWPGPGEQLVYLTGDWRILQRSDGHRWSLDDLVTAWLAVEVASGDRPAHIADLGCGIGAVLLMLAWRFPVARCVGVEAQAPSADLARRSAAWNGVGHRVEVRTGDLREEPRDGAFDLVTGTPPYLPPGTGKVPARAQQAGCHFEQRGGIEAYCTAAARLLAPHGWFIVCHAAAQRARVEHGAAASGLAIEHWREVVPRAGKPALFTVYALRHAGGVTVPRLSLPPLVVRDGAGQWTPGFRAVRRTMGMPDASTATARRSLSGAFAA